MVNRILDETKEPFWTVGWKPFLEKLRLQPTIKTILEDRWRQSIFVGKGDFVIQGVLKAGLIEDIMAGRLLAVYNTVGRLLGLPTTDVGPEHSRG